MRGTGYMSATAVTVLEAEAEAGGRGLSRGETEAGRSCLYSVLCVLPTLILTYLPEREECLPPKISGVWCLRPAVPAPESSPLGHRTWGSPLISSRLYSWFLVSFPGLITYTPKCLSPRAAPPLCVSPGRHPSALWRSHLDLVSGGSHRALGSVGVLWAAVGKWF